MHPVKPYKALDGGAARILPIESIINGRLSGYWLHASSTDIKATVVSDIAEPVSEHEEESSKDFLST